MNDKTAEQFLLKINYAKIFYKYNYKSLESILAV